MILRREFFTISVILALAMLTVTPAGPAHAEDKGPGEFVTRLGEKTIAKLTDASLTPDVRDEEFRRLLREGFAVNAIGRFVLGKYRRSASNGEIEEFVGVFEDYIVSLYAKQFKYYNGQEFFVEKVAGTSRASDSMVMTKILPNGGAEALRVNFQVRDFGDTFKVLDIRFEGVSMVLAQRDEFTSYMSKNGGSVTSLTKALRERIAAAAETAEK